MVEAADDDLEPAEEEVEEPNPFKPAAAAPPPDGFFFLSFAALAIIQTAVDEVEPSSRLGCDCDDRVVRVARGKAGGTQRRGENAWRKECAGDTAPRKDTTRMQ